MRDSITPRVRRASLACMVVLSLAGAVTVQAQAADSVPPLSTNYWRKFVLGVSTSLLLHEAGHVLTSVAVGGHPTFGFDTGRPTIYSGLNSHIEPHKQFLFSVAGLTIQNMLDEAILDI